MHYSQKTCKEITLSHATPAYLFGEEFLKGGAKKALLFLHANGIAALTYSHFLHAWSQLWQIPLVAIDQRGFGASRLKIDAAYADGRFQLWHVLKRDLIQAHGDLHRIYPEVNWIIAGHSLGAWVALLAAAHMPVDDLILFDPPLLSQRNRVLWYLACQFKRRTNLEISRRARSRKRIYDISNELHRVFSRTLFFKNWDDEHIKAFIKANYAQRGEKLVLRHNPDWEADIFEAMPPSARRELRKIKKGRKTPLRPHVIAGGDSDTCDHSWRPLIAQEFPLSTWHVVPDAGHMLVFQRESEVLSLLEKNQRNFISP